jgi:hypothetical protein
MTSGSPGSFTDRMHGAHPDRSSIPRRDLLYVPQVTGCPHRPGAAEELCYCRRPHGDALATSLALVVGPSPCSPAEPMHWPPDEESTVLSAPAAPLLPSTTVVCSRRATSGHHAVRVDTVTSSARRPGRWRRPTLDRRVVARPNHVRDVRWWRTSSPTRSVVLSAARPRCCRCPHRRGPPEVGRISGPFVRVGVRPRLRRDCDAPVLTLPSTMRTVALYGSRVVGRDERRRPSANLSTGAAPTTVRIGACDDTRSRWRSTATPSPAGCQGS